MVYADSRVLSLSTDVKRIKNLENLKNSSKLKNLVWRNHHSWFGARTLNSERGFKMMDLFNAVTDLTAINKNT